MVRAVRFFELGDRVLICSEGTEFGFVDGWRGTVTGQQGGAYEVQCVRETVFTLYVPPRYLELTV